MIYICGRRKLHPRLLHNCFQKLVIVVFPGFLIKLEILCRDSIDIIEMVLFYWIPVVNITGKITVFCTMEPCLMCYGALILAGVGGIVFAYEDVMGGGTGCELFRLKPLYKNSPVTVVPGVMRAESLNLFKTYFSNPANSYWKQSLLAEYTLGL